MSDYLGRIQKCMAEGSWWDLLSPGMGNSLKFRDLLLCFQLLSAKGCLWRYLRWWQKEAKQRAEKSFVKYRIIRNALKGSTSLSGTEILENNGIQSRNASSYLNLRLCQIPQNAFTQVLCNIMPILILCFLEYLILFRDSLAAVQCSVQQGFPVCSVVVKSSKWILWIFSMLLFLMFGSLYLVLPR